MEESKKKAARMTATTAITRPSLLRFIIMADYPQERSGFGAIVYHVASGDRRRHPPACRRLQHHQPPPRTVRLPLDHAAVRPLAGAPPPPPAAAPSPPTSPAEPSGSTSTTAKSAHLLGSRLPVSCSAPRTLAPSSVATRDALAPAAPAAR